MKTIALSNGLVALVDDSDYECLNTSNWHAQRGRNTWYAIRDSYKADGTHTTERLHRVVLGITDAQIEVDHKDGNGLNCQRRNLRIATTSQNNMNRRTPKNNTSGMKGVTWYPSRGLWHVRIHINGKRKCVGYFKDFAVAVKARQVAETEHYKEFVCVA
jgi:hypothetical protein